MFTIQLATIPGSDRPNEDFVGALNDCMVLLDGSGGPDELSSGCVHGAAWFVRQLGARLLTGMADQDQPLNAVLERCIRDVADLHRDCDLAGPGSPASMVTMARTKGNNLEYLILGDCTLAVDVGQGHNVQVVTDRRIEQVAVEKFQTMLALSTGSPEHQAARVGFVDALRHARNQPGGYPIASADPDAASHALTGDMPLFEVRRVSLLSDGATRFVSFGLGKWAELFGILDTYGPSSLFSRIREAEDGDPEGKLWPRAKTYDDIAVVHLTRQERDSHGILRMRSTGRRQPRQDDPLLRVPGGDLTW